MSIEMHEENICCYIEDLEEMRNNILKDIDILEKDTRISKEEKRNTLKVYNDLYTRLYFACKEAGKFEEEEEEEEEEEKELLISLYS